MLDFYAIGAGGLQSLPATDSAALFEKAVWIDVHQPNAQEEAFLEKHLGIDIPTRDEMRDLEESSRLYVENGALFMTAIIVSGVSQRRPVRSNITFALTQKHLVTVRYTEPLAIKTFGQKCQRQPDAHKTSDLILLSLLEQIVQRIAEILEKTATDLDKLSTAIFEDDLGALLDEKDKNVTKSLQVLVRRLGRISALVGKQRESLLSFSRLASFLREASAPWLHESFKARLNTLERDVRSLTEYEDNLVNQIGYLQDATFSLINIDQNRVIKVFTIAAVLFLPPTLVGTIYGMNFKHMPELDWTLGYPLALGMMVVSALVPYAWFRRNGWF